MNRRQLALLFSLVIGCGGAFSNAAFAEGKKEKKHGKKSKDSSDGGETYQPPYGMAGCGFGSLVINNDTVLAQIGAVTLNGTSLNQSSAISCTGSSNCEASKSDLADVEQSVFISVNLSSLERDMVTGDGSYLRAWAQVLGCEEEDDYSAFAQLSQSQYPRIFATRNPEQVRSRYLDAVRGSERLSGRCVRVFEGA